MPGFHQVVDDAWNEDSNHAEPCHILYHKMVKTAKCLKCWSRKLFSSAKLQLNMALIIVLRLDIAQESRQLSPEEVDLRARLKRRIISLAVMERARKRQRAKMTSLKEGDANTRFFHLKIKRPEEEKLHPPS